MTWSNLGGGDHEGDNWTVSDGTTIGGTHYNIATFTIESGDTITLSQGVETTVYAETINMSGTINGDSKGYANSSGPGAGGDSPITQQYSGSGGYGGAGADSLGGSTYGDNNMPHIQMGSGGGDAISRDGGYGGGSILLCADDVNVYGTISCDGGAGGAGISQTHSSGGSGGGVCIIGNTIDTTDSVISCDGGSYGGTYSYGGAGGRVKIFYFTSHVNTSATVTVLGVNSGATGTTIYTDLSLCNSTYSIGQTFHIDTGFPTGITSMQLYVDTVTTAGDFTLKIWDSDTKSTEYGSVTATISSAGVINFDFASTIQLPDTDTDYYIEINPDSTGDIKLSVNGYSNSFDGSMYYSIYPVIGIDLYLDIIGYSHVTGPSLYNTADVRTVCDIANSVLSGAVHRINRDGSGSVTYDNDFTTEKYLSDMFELSGETYDSANDELDLADDGYISWKADVKYPIAGIPILTAQIEIITGTPTIQISLDGSTWYDIDTSIVNDTSTEYNLENVTDDINFKGETIVYFRIDCTGIGTNTCTIKSLEFYTDIITTHAEIPIIDVGTSGNTFQLDQDTGSAVNCTLELEYRDRKWL